LIDFTFVISSNDPYTHGTFLFLGVWIYYSNNMSIFLEYIVRTTGYGSV